MQKMLDLSHVLSSKIIQLNRFFGTQKTAINWFLLWDRQLQT